MRSGRSVSLSWDDRLAVVGVLSGNVIDIGPTQGGMDAIATVVSVAGGLSPGANTVKVQAWGKNGPSMVVTFSSTNLTAYWRVRSPRTTDISRDGVQWTPVGASGAGQRASIRAKKPRTSWASS